MSAWAWSPWWLVAALAPYAAFQIAFLAALRRVPAKLGWDAERGAAWMKYSRRRAAGALAGALFWLYATAALAFRPERGSPGAESSGQGLVSIVVDASNSMLVGRPGSRPLDEAMRFASGLADAAGGARLSLVAFRGGAVTLCPPTMDRRAFDDAMRWIGPGVTTAAGSDFGAAIREAARPAMPGGGSRLVVVLGDGNDTGGGARESAAKAAKSGASLVFIGFGPEAPTVVTAPGGKPVLDQEGRKVSTSIDDAAMRDWAEASRGLYVRYGDPSAFTTVARACASVASRGAAGVVGPGDGVPQALLAAAIVFLGLAIVLSWPPRSPARGSPARGSPARGSPARGSPARGSPDGTGSPAAGGAHA